MVINLNQTIIWSPQGNKYTVDTGQCETHYDIENAKTTQWHEKEREGERKRGGGGRQRTETTSIMNKTKRGQKWLWTRLENVLTSVTSNSSSSCILHYLSDEKSAYLHKSFFSF